MGCQGWLPDPKGSLSTVIPLQAIARTNQEVQQAIADRSDEQPLHFMHHHAHQKRVSTNAKTLCFLKISGLNNFVCMQLHEIKAHRTFKLATKYSRSTVMVKRVQSVFMNKFRQ